MLPLLTPLASLPGQYKTFFTFVQISHNFYWSLTQILLPGVACHKYLNISYKSFHIPNIEMKEQGSVVIKCMRQFVTNVSPTFC